MCVCVCVCVCVFACVRDSVGLCVESKLDVITEKLSNQPTHCLINSYNTNTHTHTFSSMLLCVFSCRSHDSYWCFFAPAKVSVQLNGRPQSREKVTRLTTIPWDLSHGKKNKKRKENFRRHRRTARYICQSGWLLLSSVSHRAAGFPTEPTLMYPAEVWLNQYRS